MDELPIIAIQFQGPAPTPTKPDESLITHAWDSNGTDNTEILRGVFDGPMEAKE